MKPIKVAYLILAHSGFEFLDRLIAALNDNICCFYVHVDKKAPANYSSRLKNVTVLSDRSSVNWASYSLVKAEIKLLQAAIKSNSDYYVHISGSDYPIRPNQFLYDRLSSGNEFINTCKVPTEHKPLSRFDQYHFDFNRRARTPTSYSLRFTEAVLRLGWKRKKIPFELHAGSAWFALTKGAVMHVLATHKNNPTYEEFFKTCLLPDEAVFQTILANSAFKDRMTHNLTYTDWSTTPAPAIMNEGHVRLFQRQVKFSSVYGEYTPFFARKFDTSNTTLLDLIDRTLRR